jgi:hypothetical protein
MEDPMPQTKMTREERYNAAVNLTDAGIRTTAIARIVGSDPRFVEGLLAMRQWTPGKRNAWFRGLDVRKFNCV